MGNETTFRWRKRISSMLNEFAPPSSAEFEVETDFSRRGHVAHRQLFEKLSNTVVSTEFWVTSSMPRGGLQIVQPSHVLETLLKAYGKEMSLQDAGTWRAIDTGKTLRGDDCFPGGLESSRYYQDFLQPANLRYMAVAPIKAPLLPGFDGAIHLYRASDLGDFTDADLHHIAETARELGVAFADARASRQHRTAGPAWLHRPSGRQFILNADLQPQLNADLAGLDSRIRDQIISDARHRLANLNGDGTTTDRLAVPDTNGDLWVFRVTLYPRYPGLGEGVYIFYCLQPESREWGTLRASDVSADPELARLIPAVQFMQDEFKRGPTLLEISKTAHLSPFHFHRRFTELMGITPKHLLLDCQIFEAKKQLVSGEKDLADIAASCGFAHQSHFTSRFKQATGLTPTRWRKLALQKYLGAKA